MAQASHGRAPTYLETGAMMPQDGIDMLRKFDAIYRGACW
jgi:isocitrate/isopropylmalate dehydrogenase